MNPLLSLCIPTYGISEWVFPVLDSIYSQDCSLDDFEVVVTDNGTNQEFYGRMMEYQEDHRNLVYRKTDAKLFLNEIESYKNARGQLIKFINHRTLLLPGALQYFIEFVKKNQNRKPITYFTNGVLHKKPEIIECDSFERFLDDLGYWSSWSTGLAVWKEDFERLNLNKSFNELFPHTTILFDQTKRDYYLIDNKALLSEMQVSSTKKGSYDLFYAFAVEYPGILCDLLRNGDIDLDTFQRVKTHALECVARLYWRFVIKKEPCSYELSGFDKSLGVFYSRSQFNQMLIKCFFQKVSNQIGK